MKKILQLFFVIGFAAIAGGYSAWVALNGDMFSQAITLGPWRGHIPSRTGEVPPYEKAQLALFTRAQLGYGEGLRFIATTDSDGQLLNGACDYVIEGPAPKAKVFTLFVTDAAGLWLRSEIGLPDFAHAQSISYDANNAIQVNLSASAQSGDWLFVPKQNGFQLVLSLYSTSIGALSASSELSLPAITRGACSDA